MNLDDMKGLVFVVELKRLVDCTYVQWSEDKSVLDFVTQVQGFSRLQKLSPHGYITAAEKAAAGTLNALVDCAVPAGKTAFDQLLGQLLALHHDNCQRVVIMLDYLKLDSKQVKTPVSTLPSPANCTGSLASSGYGTPLSTDHALGSLRAEVLSLKVTSNAESQLR